jgi:hypothetical protein
MAQPLLWVGDLRRPEAPRHGNAIANFNFW